MKTLFTLLKHFTPPDLKFNSLTINVIRKKKWLIFALFFFTSSPSIISQCPTFEFCMDEPYFDSELHMFAIDVYLNGFANQYAWAIDLQIEYDNPDFIIDESATEASQYSGLAGINAEDFDLSNDGEINVKGNYDGPFHLGPQFTTFNEQFLFTIYFTATARSCSNFTFGLTGIIVSFPGTSSYAPCTGNVGNDCEPEDVCLAGFTLGGLIESPVLDCDGAFDGGIPNVDVFITDSEDVEIFGCETSTDDYGLYECDVVADLDYRVTPKHDYNHACGLTSLDIDILHDHLLTNECLEYLWQWYAGDVNGSGVLSTIDITEIQNAILEYPIDWISWQFVPASTYNSSDPPDCPGSEYNDVPPFDPYIDLEDVDENMSDLDFVGIKIGDMNATCTECSESFKGEDDIWFRSTPIEIALNKTSDEDYTLVFNEDIEGLEVFFLAFNCDQQPQITFLQFENSENFITRYADGVYYISYVSYQPEGESFKKGQPIIKLDVHSNNISQGGTQAQNEIIYGDNYSRLDLKVNTFLQDKIYPNPAHSSITIELSGITEVENCTFLIYDLLGNLVFIRPLTSERTYIEIDLVPNFYTYELKKEANSIIGKLIIQ